MANGFLKIAVGIGIALALTVSAGADDDASSKRWSSLRAEILHALAGGNVDRVLEIMPRLTEFDTPEAATFVLKHLLPSDDLLIHEEAFHTLSRLKNKEAQKVVIDSVANHKDWEIRASCVRVLASYSGEYAFSKIGEALEDKKWQVRSSALRTLGHKRRRASIPLLIERLKKDVGRLKQDAVWSLRRITGQTYEADYADWNNWWTANESFFEIPTLTEVKKNLEDGPKDLKTAVESGLYGRIYSEKIAFLFDVSGSMRAGTDMQGTRAEIAFKQLIDVLENQLTPKTYFNIIAFSEDVLPLKKRLTKAKPSAVKSAKKWVQKLAVGGETNVYGALKAAFEDRDVDTIYLLSDGVPTVGEESIPELIQREVAKWNRDRRIIINCIGFFPGDAKNQDKAEARTFLLRLAEQNEGFYKEIY